MTSFLATYAFYNVWHIVDVRLGDDYAFWDILLGDLLFPALCCYVPIMLVLYTHFRNIVSLQKLLKITWTPAFRKRKRPLPHSESSVGENSGSAYLQRIHNVTVFIDEMEDDDTAPDPINLLQDLRRKALTEDSETGIATVTETSKSDRFELPVMDKSNSG